MTASAGSRGAFGASFDRVFAAKQAVDGGGGPVTRGVCWADLRRTGGDVTLRAQLSSGGWARHAGWGGSPLLIMARGRIPAHERPVKAETRPAANWSGFPVMGLPSPLFSSRSPFGADLCPCRCQATGTRGTLARCARGHVVLARRHAESWLMSRPWVGVWRAR